jgi:hypothetical protein
MAGMLGVPMRRGAIAGVLLVLLGAWGGLIAFIGPYFHCAYIPDRAWSYTTGGCGWRSFPAPVRWQAA